MSQKIGAPAGVPANFPQVIRDKVEASLAGPEGETKVRVFGPGLEILERKARRIAAIAGAIVSAALFTLLLLPLLFPYFARESEVPPG